MATIYNSQLSKELIKAARLQTSKDTIPNQIADKVVPVMEVNPKLLRETNIIRRFGDSTNSTNNILYTTPATGSDFYLTGAILQFDAGVLCDTSTVTLSAILYDSNATTTILDFRCRTAPADGIFKKLIWYNFPHPIRIKRNSTILFSDNGTTANLTKACTIFGYLDEVSDA